MPLQFQFCSGISRKVDFLGITDAGMAPGVQVGDLQGQLRETAFAHVSRGGALFVDSGAFPAFMAGGVDVDFDSVLSTYEALASASTRPEALFVVAPDKVGDPVETLRLLRLYAARLAALSLTGISILAPVQLGGPDMAATWSEVRTVLAGVKIIPAMPMRAAAARIDQVLTFLQQSGETTVHLLGTSKQQNFDALGLFCPGVVFTADANRIRAYVGKGRPITEDYRENLRDECSAAWMDGGAQDEDGTEFTFNALNVQGFLRDSEIEKIVAFIGDADAAKIRTALRRCELAEVIEADFMDLVCMYPLPEVHAARVARQVGAGIRQQALTKHFSGSSRHQTGALFNLTSAA
jgi:hypothetical protein